MEVGINNHLKRISSELLIKPKSLAGLNIERSIKGILKNIGTHFGKDVEDARVFGSYSRKTILPHQYDAASDVDILVLFDCTNGKLRPESYRERLRKFANAYYQRGRIVKDHPSIVIELDHINFDLVPALFDDGVFYDSIEIPDKDGGWLETNPDKFNKELTHSNKQYGSIVKPIIRLIKY